MIDSIWYRRLLTVSIAFLAAGVLGSCTTPESSSPPPAAEVSKTMTTNQEYYELRLYRIPGADKQKILHPRGIQVVDLASLSQLLGETMGHLGTQLFYLGVFAALFSSMVGNGAAYGLLISDAYINLRPSARAQCNGDYKRHPVYQWVIYWVVLSPTIWLFLGHGDFVGLTVTINAAQVMVLPFLVGGIWVITASGKYIGPEHKNRWWENALVGVLFAVALVSAYFSVIKVLQE